MNKRQKGITLIALVITIIILLILVSVTVTVAINSSLFDRARKDADQTRKQADHDALISAVYGSKNKRGKIDRVLLIENVHDIDFKSIEPDGITGNFPYLCISKNDNAFLVDENGNITEVANGSITLNLSSVKLDNGSTQELTAILSGEEGTVEWRCSNTDLVTLSTNTGNTITITADSVNTGKATITATCNGKSASCVVIVGDGIPLDLKKYILGQNMEGREISEIYYNYSFIEDPAENSNKTIHNDIKISEGNYFRYDLN